MDNAMKYEEINIGDIVSLTKQIIISDIDLFSMLTGDNNPIHSGDNAIVQGMLVSSFIATLIGTKLPGDGAIWFRQTLTFSSPVYVNDTITVTIMVVDKTNPDTIRLYNTIVNQHGVLVFNGSAMVKCAE
jgi:acyl dehydratase